MVSEEPREEERDTLSFMGGGSASTVGTLEWRAVEAREQGGGGGVAQFTREGRWQLFWADVDFPGAPEPQEDTPGHPGDASGPQRSLG